jgi:hypothetical protein
MPPVRNPFEKGLEGAVPFLDFPKHLFFVHSVHFVHSIHTGFKNLTVKLSVKLSIALGTILDYNRRYYFRGIFDALS